MSDQTVEQLPQPGFYTGPFPRYDVGGVPVKALVRVDERGWAYHRTPGGDERVLTFNPEWVNEFINKGDWKRLGGDDGTRGGGQEPARVAPQGGSGNAGVPYWGADSN